MKTAKELAKHELVIKLERLNKSGEVQEIRTKHIDADEILLNYLPFADLALSHARSSVDNTAILIIRMRPKAKGEEE